MQKRFVMCTLLGAAVFAVGCAQDVGDIDRTQPNKLRKEIFVGDPADPSDDPQWYFRQTVVDTPGTGTLHFVGLEGEVERVKFVIQENVLVAHRVYEDIIGIDTSRAPSLDAEDPALDGIEFSDDFLGAPVLAFQIQSHFDVQRQYNSSTGEQMNVLTENMSDRHWRERDFIRVYWEGNRVSSLYPSGPIPSMDGSPGPGNVPLTWYSNGEDGNLSPLNIECKDEVGNWIDCDAETLEKDANVSYIEITENAVWEPDWISCLLEIGIPFYGGLCGPQTITVRSSFMKVEEEEVQAFEPRVYDNQEMEWFGFFRTNRCAYDRLYGCRDQTQVRLANVHNIWESWYVDTDDNGEYNEGVDQYIPMSERGVRPLKYYLNEGYPTDLIDVSVLIADQYDEAFREVVRGNGNSYDGRMFYLCANNAAQVEGLPDELKNALMQGYNDGVCDRPEKVKHLGDIRYGYFAWVNDPAWNGPLGYGPSTVDPITGQNLAGNAYIYGASMDTYAQYTVDLIDVINGHMTAEEYGMAENIEGYIQDTYKKFNFPDRGLAATGSSVGVTAQDLERYAQLEEKLQGATERQLRWRERGVSPDQMELHDFLNHDDRHIATWEQMKGTKIEALAVTPEIKAGLGLGNFAPTDPTTEEMIENIGPRAIGLPKANGVDMNFHRAGMFAEKPMTTGEQTDHWDRFNRYASRNIFMAEFIDDGLQGLAFELADRYKDISDHTERRLRMFYDVRELIFRHVMEHEVGHTVGLRHNFEASYDSMSYHPDYWKIRFAGDETLKAMNQDCPGTGVDSGIKLGDHHCPSRGLIDRDWDNRIMEYAYSSTMDYGSKPNSQVHGIGLYDKAAIAYAYGDLVHVFKEGAEPNKFKVVWDHDLIEDANGDIQFGNGYGELAGNSGLPSELGTKVMEPSSDTITDWEDIDDVKLFDSDDGIMVTDDVIDRDLDFWHYSVLPVMFGGDSGNMDRMYEREFVPVTTYNPENPTRLRVPYRFCTDDLRGAYPHCNVFDDGADFAEISSRYVRDYNGYYFNNSYRRGRPGYGLWIWPHLSRMLNRYFNPIASMYQHWVIRASQWDYWQLNPYGGGSINQVAIEDGLREMLGVLTQPHPGTYHKYTVDNPVNGTSKEVYLNISNEVGEGNEQSINLEPGLNVRWRFARFDFDGGYYFQYRYNLLSSFWDRYAAFMAITNPSYNAVGIDAASDISAFLIPYYLLYSKELSEVFGGIMTEDFAKFAPRINVAAMNEMAQGASGVDGRPVLEVFDPLASQTKKTAYLDPTKYLELNPYAASYGNSGFNDRYFASMYGLAMFQVLYDMSFNHAANIRIVNHGGIGGEGYQDSDGDGYLDVQETVDNDAGFPERFGDGINGAIDPNDWPCKKNNGNYILNAEGTACAKGQLLDNTPSVVTYQDPFNGAIYASVEYAQVRAPLYSVGNQILKRANHIKKCWKTPTAEECAGTDYNEYDVQNIREDIEIMMQLNSVFGGPILD